MPLYCDICGQKIDDLNNVNDIIDNVTECSECLCPINKMLVSPIPDGSWVKAISTDESFMNAMVKLFETDPIEYQLKIQQFKNLLQQQEQIKEKNCMVDNTPKCPHCQSTNIKSISGLNRGISIAVLGIFSKKINKSFECKNCGYTW